ncbi:hypothetical protein [Luteolibacter soli]|uniref:Uncharacterized protein n=1 Tax=Luteolibacter soli TaxID=3135280 RepID=A0ABU9AU70_9BACT
MKLFPPLITAACAVLCISSLSAQEPPVLSLDKRPTYQTLTAAGFKLLNRDPSYGNQLQATEYSVEAGRFLLNAGDSRSIPFESDDVGVGFAKHELTPPGAHYPPALPVQDSTPISRFSFSCTYPDLAAARAALASLEKPLQLDMTKVDAWIQHRLWESAPGLKLAATVPDAKATVSLYYQPEDQGNGRKVETRLSFQFQWNVLPPKEGQPGGARPPRLRTIPPPQGQQGQPAQPPQPVPGQPQ